MGDGHSAGGHRRRHARAFDRRSGKPLEHARGALSSESHHARLWARTTSIIDCASTPIAIRPRIRPIRISACRLRRSSGSMRSYSSAAICAPRCRCWRIACARRRCAARKSLSSIRHDLNTASRVAAYHETSPATLVAELAAILAACLAEGATAAGASRRALVRAAKVEERHRAVGDALLNPVSAALSGSGRSRCGIRHSPICARSRRPWARLPEQPSASSPRAPMPPERISPAPCRTARSAGARPKARDCRRGKCCASPCRPTCFSALSPGMMRSIGNACARSRLLTA